MTSIIYSEKLIDIKENKCDNLLAKEVFKEAVEINQRLLANHYRIAYFFIDPLMNAFEAANRFYFGIFECKSINKINTYRSGASPIQALSDAKELIDNNLYDAVFIFGYEPLQLNKNKYGKDEIKKAMNIFEDKSLIECYNLIAHKLCEEMDISREQFLNIANQLYENYKKTFGENTNIEVEYKRGPLLDDLKADLFKMSDCANPNINFVGGIVLANDKTADFLQVPRENRIKVSSAKYNMVEGLPENIGQIVGHKENIFPHLKEAILEAENESGIDFKKEFMGKNLLLEVYTCYPPIPIAFLLVTRLIENINEITEFLDNYSITITGGMNFARAPWNNPALNGLIDMYELLKNKDMRYGLVHGNGGIGEVQGVAVLEKSK